MGRGVIRWITVAATAILILNGASASASTVSVPLSQTSFGDMVVDDANQHVFISSPADNSIAVFDFSGNLVTTLTNLPGASGMLIVGSTLYVAEGTSGAIEKLDVSTFADQGSLATGLTSPRWLAYASGKIWVTETEQQDQADQLASITLSGTTTIFPTAYYGADLATSSATPNDLYLSEDGLSPGDIIKFSVSGGTPVVLASNRWAPINEGLAISPDGARVIPSGGSSGGFDELSAATLAPDGIVYPGLNGLGYTEAVAVSPGGGGLLATGNKGYGSPDVAVFPLGATAPTFTASFPGSNGWGQVAKHGLAVSASGAKLFVVSSDAPSTTFAFSVFTLNPTTTGTTVSVSPTPPVVNQPITFTSTVAPTDGGGTVSFSADGQPVTGCTAVPLLDAPVGSQSTCTTSSLSLGAHTITATYSGDSAYSGSTGNNNFTVLLPPGSDYTWSGGSTFGNWSTGANWTQGVAPYGSVGTLTFPTLSSATCCSPFDDLSNLTANAMVVNSDSDYYINGNGLSLGAGGLTVDSPSGTAIPPTIALALTLTSPQTWNIDEGPTQFPTTVSGTQSLTLDFQNGSIEPGVVDVGDIAAAGTGGFYLDGGSYVNFGSPNPITLSAGSGIEADRNGNAVGPLSVGSGGWLSVGGVDNGGGTLDVGGVLTFSSGSELDLGVDAPGASAGLDYSQVTATGNIDISGAKLNMSQGPDMSGNCDDLSPGDVLTLLNTTGSLTGTFSNYANGATVDIVNACNGANQDATGTLAYTSNAVTLTITSGGNAGTGAPVELTAPSLSGTAQVGQTLQIDPGTWQGATSFQYSWWACNASTCTLIPSATSATFQLTPAQLGYQIGAMVTAVGPGGSSYDYTNLSAPVIAQPVTGPRVPSVYSPPTISGTPVVGDVLTATSGTWLNSPVQYSYQWERCSSNGTGCAPIFGATSQTYTVTSADLGSTIEVQVTATNGAGTSGPDLSVRTGVVASSPVVMRAAIVAALDSVSTPTGKAASVRTVLSHHGYAFVFVAPGPGKLVVTWTTTLKRKQVAVAKGTATAAGERPTKIFVRLTVAGANLLRRSQHLTIRSSTTFTATGLTSIKKSSSFTLHGRSKAHRAGRASLLRRLFGGNRATRPRTQIPRSAFRKS